MTAPVNGFAPEDVTSLLLRWNDPTARDRLFELVLPELRRIAEHRMRQERAGHTLTPAALVNEAFLRLVKQDKVTWRSRAHFLAIAALAMRRLLIDYAKNRKVHVAPHTGGQDPDHFGGPDPFYKAILVEDALTALERHNPRLAKVFRLRHFYGATFKEIALDIEKDRRTAIRDWNLAREWLKVALRLMLDEAEEGEDGDDGSDTAADD